MGVTKLNPRYSIKAPRFIDDSYVSDDELKIWFIKEIAKSNPRR